MVSMQMRLKNECAKRGSIGSKESIKGPDRKASGAGNREGVRVLIAFLLRRLKSRFWTRSRGFDVISRPLPRAAAQPNIDESASWQKLRRVFCRPHAATQCWPR